MHLSSTPQRFQDMQIAIVVHHAVSPRSGAVLCPSAGSCQCGGRYCAVRSRASGRIRASRHGAVALEDGAERGGSDERRAEDVRWPSFVVGSRLLVAQASGPAAVMAATGYQSHVPELGSTGA